MAKRYLSTNPGLERMEKIEDCLSFYDGRGARIGTYDPQTEGSAKRIVTQLRCAREVGYLTKAKCKQYIDMIQTREADKGFENIIKQLEDIRKTAEEKRAS